MCVYSKFLFIINSIFVYFVNSILLTELYLFYIIDLPIQFVCQ